MNRITKADFDNAVKQEWGRTTCVAAQMVKRLTGELPNSSWDSPAAIREWGGGRTSPEEYVAMNTFDQFFNEPGDENKLELQQLRDSLS